MREGIRDRWAGVDWTYGEEQADDRIICAYVLENGSRIIDLGEPYPEERDFLSRAAAAPSDVQALLRNIERLKADIAAWWQIVSDLYQIGCLDCSNNSCDRAKEALGAGHPGEALLAELAAARALADAIREHPGCLVDDERLDAAPAPATGPTTRLRKR